MTTFFSKTYNRVTGFRSSLEVESPSAPDTFWGSHIFLEALVNLIEETDTDSWAKSDAELSAEDYHRAVLRALANHVRRAGLLPRVAVRAELLRLVDELDA